MRVADGRTRGIAGRNDSAPFTELDIGSLVVAHLVARENMSYEEVQELTGCSRATVARRLKHAKKKGWLLERLELQVPQGLKALRDAYVEQVHHLSLEQSLLAHLQRYGVRNVTVVSDHESRRAGAWVVPRRIGRAAALRLAEALQNQSGVVGVNWGWSTMWAIQLLPQPVRPKPDVVFVPLMGNLSIDQRLSEQYEQSLMCSANRLSRLAGEVYGAPFRRLTTPAFIPKRFATAPVGEGSEEALNTVWSVIEEDLSYLDVFGAGHRSGASTSGAGLVDRMDMIVTGMSGLETTSTLTTMARLIDERELGALREAGYVGDLGGHFIRDPMLPPGDPQVGQLADAISGLVVSAKPEDFVRTARRARETGNENGGVFMIGRRPQKAPAFIAACRMGAVNELFTDEQTAQRMLEILESDQPVGLGAGQS